MSQTKENVKKPISGLIFTHLAQIQTPKFFRKLYLYQKLDIVPSYHPTQFKEKLISQTEENVKNLIYLEPDFGPKFFFGALPLLVVKHFSELSCQAIQRKTTRQTKKNVKNLLLGPILTHLAKIQTQKFFSEPLPPLKVRHWCKLSSQAISREIKKLK